MFVSMNLVAGRGHGYTSTVGGARVGAIAARVGASAARASYDGVTAKVTDTDHYSDATVRDKDEVDPAVNAAQCQV